MFRPYSHLLSPLKLENGVVLKNRMIASPARPHYIQADEPYPTEGLIAHFARKAQNGAAIVTCNGRSPMPLPKDIDPVELPDIHQKFIKWPIMSANHEQALRMEVGKYQHYFSQLTDAIHYYNSLASIFVVPDFPVGYDCSSGVPSTVVEGDANVLTYGKEITRELMERVCDSYAQQCLLAKHLGFDAAFLHMCYRGMLPSRFLSPLTNHRTDEFGGSLENRARFPLMIADRIKEVCGQDFVLELAFTAEENYPGGWTMQDTIDFAKLAEGRVDLLQVRSGDIDPNHPTGFCPERTPFLHLAQELKASGCRIPVVSISGWSDLDDMEDAIASGKCDCIAMARSFISNPDFGDKAYEGRGDDVVPCLRCNKCHRSSNADSWVSACSVNPAYGMEHRIKSLCKEPGRKKNIAIIGGGASGMRAALFARERGHDVTLFEKASKLGGQLNPAGTAAFKWPLRDYREYLIRQVYKQGVRVLLSTDPAPDSLGEFDEVVAATGAEPNMPGIPGINSGSVIPAVEVYGNLDRIKGKVVVVGGGEIGVETGMYTAQNGYETLVLEMTDTLAADSTPIHYRSMFREYWEKIENFHGQTEATVVEIRPDCVIWRDSEGGLHEERADTVVIAAGMKPRTDEALRYSASGGRFHMIGDCRKVGNIHKANRSAFAIVSQI